MRHEVPECVVAAAAGRFAIVFMLLSDDGETVRPGMAGRPRPRPEDVFVRRLPIVAWWVRPGLTLPVVGGSVDDVETAVLIEAPDGLEDAGGSLYPDIETAQAAFVERAQASWDRQAGRAAL